jgi:hypothetical protein
MSDQASTPDSSGHERNGKPDTHDDDREAAMMRDVLRVQEQHREGGAEPGLDPADREPEPDA